MALSAGTRLGHFEIETLLGAGGMGEVYKAHDSRLNRTVAIKVLRPETATEDRLRRFEQEARAASALNHPNILTIYDVGRDGDVVYFAMEWVDGRTLRDSISGARLPMRRVIDLCHQVAEGLAKAHAASIVHRDLKPENVMVSHDGFAKIVDFGLAKLTESSQDEGQTVTRSVGAKPGLVMGNGAFGYMSPEQVSGDAVDYTYQPVRAGVDCLRDGDRQAAVRSADHRAGAGGDHRGGAATDRRLECRSVAAPCGGRGTLSRQRSSRPLRVHARSGTGPEADS